MEFVLYRLNGGERGQSSIMGTGCYDDMTPGGRVVLLNHDSSTMATAVSGGNGLTGDCTLTGRGGSSGYQRSESNGYKTTADLLKLCSRGAPVTSAGYYHGGCMPPEVVPEVVQNRSTATRSAGGVVYSTTGTCRYARAGDGVNGDNLQTRWTSSGGEWAETNGRGVELAVEEDEDNQLIGTNLCTCIVGGSDRCNIVECHRCRDKQKTTNSTMDNLLQYQDAPPSATTADPVPKELCFNEELVRCQMMLTREGVGRGGSPSSCLHGQTTGSPSVYDCVLPGLRDPELVMMTFKGSPTARQQKYLASTVATLPHAVGSVSGSTSDSGYDTTTYKISPTNSNHICS